ncbi:MAG: hypothetical protein HY365_00085 [Candidatus Aenigmarchaeota archaeon]|nr:hypothetical protein [Candidatus Aenigmarchaeota archaeon]
MTKAGDEQKHTRRALRNARFNRALSYANFIGHCAIYNLEKIYPIAMGTGFVYHGKLSGNPGEMIMGVVATTVGAAIGAYSLLERRRANRFYITLEDGSRITTAEEDADYDMRRIRETSAEVRRLKELRQ